MAITILAPKPAAEPYEESDRESDDSSDDGGANLEGDIDMRPKKKRRNDYDIVTPGESVTDDPQWMRYNVPSLSSSQPQLI
jgi:exosome complex component RRP4